MLREQPHRCVMQILAHVSAWKILPVLVVMYVMKDTTGFQSVQVCAPNIFKKLCYTFFFRVNYFHYLRCSSSHRKRNNEGEYTV